MQNKLFYVPCGLTGRLRPKVGQVPFNWRFEASEFLQVAACKAVRISAVAS